MSRRTQHGRTKDQGRSAYAAELLSRVQRFSDTLPPFGPKLGLIDGRQAADVIVCHRITNKLELPLEGDPVARRAMSIAGFIERNQDPEIDFSHPAFRLAKARINHWLKGFKPRYTFVAPTGASARSTGLDQDIAVKLSDLRNWEVSPALFEYAYNIIWNNHALKRMVRAKFAEAAGDMRLVLLDSFRQGETEGYKMFRKQFKYLVTFNAVSRVEVVPKDNQNDRVISCEPLWNMICQLSYMTDIRVHLDARIGYNISHRADLHKEYIAANVATIDLKAASDFLSWKLVRTLWPDCEVARLSKLRPSVVEHDGEYHHLNMFAPMGSGITFDVMTITIWALLGDATSVSVFGDDIICSPGYADTAIDTLRRAGLVVNVQKSFTSGQFRESCGGYYHDMLGYIVSYDIKYPLSLSHDILLANKLSMIIAAKQISFELEGILLNTLHAILATIPRDAFGDHELSLQDGMVTGFQTPYSSDLYAIALGLAWHRPVILTRQCVQVSIETTSGVCPHVALAMFLHRGNVTPVLKKTNCRRYQIDAWSLQRLKTLDLQSHL